jgi:opacity protein-like surface antigen
MKNRISILIATLTIFAVSAVLADNNQTVTNSKVIPNGFYLEGDVGYASIDHDVEYLYLFTFFTAKTQILNNDGFSWNGNVGYKINQYLAVEAGFGDYPNDKYKIYFVSQDARIADVRYTNNYAFDLVAKGILPLNNGLNLFIKGGLASTHSTETDDILFAKDATSICNHLGVDIGGGMGYAITPHLEAVLQGNIILGNLIDFKTSQATLGLAYHF